MQVEWATIAALADTKAVDLWMLFPLGQGVLRLLTKKTPPPEEWARAITRILGTEEWRPAWYRDSPQQPLFEEMGDGERLSVDWHGIINFVVARLKTVYVDAAANPMILRNSKNVPLYLLTFAASNPLGAKAAIRIAEWILGRPRHGRK
jgi:three-Cys-motif partner protein